MNQPQKKCPECAEMILKDARVCKHCGYRYSTEELAKQQKEDEEAAQAMGLGCLAILVIGGLIWAVSTCSESPEDKEPLVSVYNSGNSSNAAAAEITEPTKANPKPETIPSPTPSLSRNEAGEGIATAINLNGFLCAKVIEAKPLRMKQDVYEVTCIEYRGGSGRVRYIVDANSGVAYKP